ncbi:hypothetical protein HPB50_014465 [Hyalomma asiaticum]|uniref:Uncharacterized protein n=1 Tax=Hyalomma asiaticum TaxID=266040 RepID=A0ACB7T4W7_HYAAI|nr:hypothetical protein HPB50_014465 [Hyalomma asiaticum]
MSSYGLPANADENVLSLKIAEVQGNLRSLNISNCIVAKPASLLTLLANLKNLQSLSCIACPLAPSMILRHLLKALRGVSHLEMSFIADKNDAREELAKVQHLSNEVGQNNETQVRELYAEVADYENMEVLWAFLRGCPHVSDLHIHFMQRACCENGLMAFTRMFEHLRNLKAFTITCEAHSSNPEKPLDLHCCVDTQGNVVFRENPTRFNYALLHELAQSPNPVLPHTPVVLVAVESEDLDACLFIAGLSRGWRDLQSLCILHLSPRPDQAPYPTIGDTHDAALRNLFNKLSNLVELNVSSLHFGEGLDLTKLLSKRALARLRALSLPPCGLPKRGTTRRLALYLGDVEDLDVRFDNDGRHSSCSYCGEQLLVEAGDVKAFSGRLSRLTLSNVPNLLALGFLRSYPAAHLRFIDYSTHPRFHFKALLRPLRHSNALRSLVVKLTSIDFNTVPIQLSMYPPRALERLCLLSESKLRTSNAELAVESMANQLPSIFYLHMHYVDEADTGSNVTWIRLPGGQPEGQPRRGKVMQRTPCIMCSTQTFIALAKPRCREL